jgi:hypothetical protein
MDNTEELQSGDNNTTPESFETTTLFDISKSVENVVIDVTHEILSNNDEDLTSPHDETITCDDDDDDDNINEYQELLTKHAALVQAHNEQFILYQDLQQKYIIDTEFRDNEYQELQSNCQRIIAERILNETTQLRETCENVTRENTELKLLNSDMKNDLADYLFKFDVLTDTLRKTNNDLIELQEMSKNELTLRNNNAHDDIDKCRLQMTHIQQQLTEKTKENEVLRDENTQNVTKLNGLLTRIDKNDKSCVIN